MNHLSDQQLLRDYTERRVESAFTELVRRHVDLVYSAALRMVRDAHLAEDVTQAVFVALAKMARQLIVCPALEGWLHGTTRNLAANAVRAEVRRRTHEQEAASMNEMLSAGAGVSWKQVAPYLDDALAELSEPERDALLLRYFKNQDFRTVGATLGISDDAAQKRVSRAVERLREMFAKRGVTVEAGGLVVVLSANAVQAAPVALTAALAGTATTASTMIAATTKTIAMTTLQKTLVTATVAVLTGAGIYEARQAAHLRDQVQTLQQQQTTSVDELATLRKENKQLSNLVANAKDQTKLTQAQLSELMKLRNEVGLLRRQTNELANLKNASTGQASQTAPTNESPDLELVSRAEYEFAGFAEPQATVKTLFWAMSQGDVQTCLAASSPAEQSRMRQAWKDLTEDQIKVGLLKDSDNRRVTAYRLTNKLVVNENEVVLTLFQEGRNREKKMRLVRIDDEWKFDGNPGI